MANSLLLLISSHRSCGQVCWIHCIVSPIHLCVCFNLYTSICDHNSLLCTCPACIHFPRFIQSQENDEKCIKALIAFGADVNATNEFNMTPLDMAQQNQVCI